MIRCETKVSLVYMEASQSCHWAIVTAFLLIKAQIYYLNLIGNRINLIERVAKHIETV